MKASETLDFLATKFEVPVKDFPDGGFILGSGEDEVRGALVTWMATPEALQAAVDNGLNLIICHESFLWYEREEVWPYREAGPFRKAHDWKQHPDLLLTEFALKNKLTVLHIHYALDRAYIFEDFFAQLGIREVVSGSIYEKVYSLPRPMRFAELVEHVGNIFQLPMLRFLGDENKIIRQLGNCWGGVGLSSNRYFARRLFEEGADAIMCGEIDEMAFFFAQQCGGALIETSHCLSENYGIARFTRELGEFFKIPVHFFEIKTPWQSKNFRS